MKNSFETLKDYLFNFHTYGDMSQTELHNFCLAFMDFVFRINGLNVNDYDITLRFNRNSANPSSPEANYDCKCGKWRYDVALNKTPFYTDMNQITFGAKTHSKFSRYSKEKSRQHKLNYQTSRIDAILRVIADAGHEFHHLIQFIKNIEADYKFQEAQESIRTLKDSDYSNVLTSRQQRTFRKSLSTYSHCMDTLEESEVEADKSSDFYCRSMVSVAKSMTDDENFIEFLDNMYLDFVDIDKQRFAFLNSNSHSLHNSESLISRYLDKINLNIGLKRLQGKDTKSDYSPIEAEIINTTN